MGRPVQLDEIRSAILDVLNSLHLELYDLEFHSGGSRGVLRVFIDKPGGVLLEDCERASRNIAPVLEVHDFIENAYQLEVSSPGLDRALKKRDDFIKVIGKTVRISTKEPINGRNLFVGSLLSITDEGEIAIQVKAGKNKAVEKVLFENIARANLEVEW
ncbi:MAG TPA: ribosome maturation factor RimP [Nitrospiria bacterium]|nr:ribosome maturation factor RimP [Nitrospiria bacterium]